MTISQTTPHKYGRLGDCSICHRQADWNSPAIDPSLGLDASPLYCDSCARDAAVYTIGISQSTVDGKRHYHDRYQSHRKRGITFHARMNDGVVEAAWIGGIRAIPSSAVDAARLHIQRTKPWTTWTHTEMLEAMLDHLADIVAAGRLWCTSCQKEMPEAMVAGYPLFAGVACGDCWALHLEGLESQRRQGHVCSMCGQPYGNCCC